MYIYENGFVVQNPYGILLRSSRNIKIIDLTGFSKWIKDRNCYYEDDIVHIHASQMLY